MALPPPEPALPIALLRNARGAEADTVFRIESELLDLHHEFRNRLMRYLITFGLRTHDAEEIIQEVFLALFRHLRDGKSQENLRGWMFRVAHNLALKQRTEIRRLTSLQVVDGLFAEHVDPGPNPEQQVTARQRQERLRAVLEALPERDRWCLVLRAEGLAYREIAQVVGSSLGSVCLAVQRALARLANADGRL